MIVLLSDGESKTIMKTLTFVSGVMNVTTQSQEAAAVGGTVSFELETDLDYEVVIPDDAKEWLSRVETRALRQETLTFSAKANETMEERQAKIELISSGVVVETLLVYQKANLDPTAFVDGEQHEEHAYSSADGYGGCHGGLGRRQDRDRDGRESPARL